jgi:predicted phage terminase large subunit-like protein
MLPFAPSRPKVSPRVAQAELALRKGARQNFLKYCQYVDPRYETPQHLQLVASKLQQVLLFLATRGQQGISRLIIMMPPQHGKSEMVSRHFPACALGLLPDLHVILASYGADLAVKHSRSVRDRLTSSRYKALFGDRSSKDVPVELSSDSRSVGSWDLAQPYRGGLLATGVGGGVTGNPADLFIIDDPFKNREEAESESRRELVDDWWKSSAKTRLSPFAAVILFHTRWHSDDLAGRLIKRMVSDPLAAQWEIVDLPAFALDEYPASAEEQIKRMRDEGIYVPLTDPLGRKAGEALWPGRYDANWLISQKADIGPYDFEALYQQQPYSKEGQRYKREWFRTVTKLPEGVTIRFIVRLWDKANSAAGDFTAGVLIAYCSDGYFYILDIVRKQMTSYERDQRMLKTAETDRDTFGKVHIWHQQDPGSAGKDSAEATNRMLMGFTAKFEPVTGSKEDRSGPLESAFQGGMVFLMQGAWNEAFVDECVSFPRGRYDDQVDAASGAYNKLLEMIKRPQREVKSYQG